MSRVTTSLVVGQQVTRPHALAVTSQGVSSFLSGSTSTANWRTLSPAIGSRRTYSVIHTYTQQCRNVALDTNRALCSESFQERPHDDIPVNSTRVL